ncbi:MAG: cobalamin-binding protein [Casimicrobiaceae bacterium]
MGHATALLVLLAFVVSDAPAAVVALDASGATVTLAAPAKRVISLAPHATELLFAVGAGDDVVGVLSPADWPPEAASRPRVGDSGAINLEGILALRPDLVVAWPYLAPAQVERLRTMGIAVYLSNPRTIDAIADDIERLGTLTGHVAAAGRAAAAFRARLAAARERASGAARVRVFYEIWNQPLYTIGGDHLISAAISLCGGENVFAALTVPAPQVSVESVLAAAPDAIVAGADRSERPAWLDAWSAWPDLPAVARGNLFVVDANLLHRAGPRFVDGVEQLCSALASARANTAARGTAPRAVR